MSRLAQFLGVLALLSLLAPRASAEGAPFPISPDAGLGFKIHIFDKERKPGELSGIEKFTAKLKAHSDRMAAFKAQYGDRQDKEANRAYWRAFFNRKPKAPSAATSAGAAEAAGVAPQSEPVPPKAIPVADGETE